VHVNCLNAWRGQSAEANKFCSVCKYRYRINRPKWAESVVTSHSVLVFTVCALVLLLAFFGVAVHAVSRLEIVQGWLYRLSGARSGRPLDILLGTLHIPMWCDWNAFSYSKQVTRKIWEHYAVEMAQANDSNVLARFITRLYQFWVATKLIIGSVLPIYLHTGLLCNEVAYNIISVIVCGLSVVSAWGAARYAHSLLYERMVVGGDRHDHIYLLSMAATLYSIGSYAVRFIVLIGCAFAVKEVYSSLEQMTKSLAQYVEAIQEPEPERSS
jgi:hypothetical protein